MNSKSLLSSFAFGSLSSLLLYYTIKKLIIKNNPYSKSESIFSLMRKTPLIYINSLSHITQRKIYAKCEHYLPYTCKDRIIKNIILKAQREGKLNKNSVIYEGSCGTAAYSVAAISMLLGYKCIVIIPDNCSKDKINLLKSTQCEIKITKQCTYSNYKDNYIRLAKKMANDDPNGFYINQFFNTVNMHTHYTETGPEIYEQLNGEISAFVCSGGTGGTIAGVGKYLKEKNNKIKVFLGDVYGSGMMSYVKERVMFAQEESEGNRKKERHSSTIEGIGVNFLTDNFKDSLIDDAYKISDNEARFMEKYIYEKDGLFIGGSSAVNLCAVVKMCKDNKVNIGDNVVTVIFDSGSRYISKVYSQETQQVNPINDISQI